MKIGIDIRELEKYRMTGIGRILLTFLKLSGKLKPGWEFILFGNQSTDFSRPELDCCKKIVMKEKITFVWDQVKIKNALHKENIDLFFSPYYKIPVFSSIPSVVSLFDLTYIIADSYKRQLKNRIYIKSFIRFASKKAKIILTCSNSTKKDLIKILNIPEEKIEVVYLAIDEKFRPVNHGETERVRKKYKIKKRYILYVGNDKPHKNLNRLIEAFALLPDSIKEEYCLVLAGAVRCQTLKADDMGQSDSALPISYVSEEDLPGLYSGAELFVFPSLYEGFGLTPLEAISCGCPVVSSNTSSMPEILGDACLYFNPYVANEMSSAVTEILKNDILRNEYRQKGFERAKLFSPEKMSLQLLSIFEGFN